MEENKNLVEETENTEQQTVEENVEQITESDVVEDATSNEETVEKQVETFTKEQVDEIVAKKIARTKAKMQKQYEAKENKHKQFENLVMAGTQTSSPEEAYNKLNDFYVEKGITIPKYEPSYDDRDVEVLATNDANEIISYGYDEIVEEVDRLNEIGYENMSKRDKILFQKLATERQKQEEIMELQAIGVSEDILENKDFINYANKLNPKLSLKEKYEMYLGTQPKKEINNMGSMKNTPVEKTIKDFYTVEEAQRLTDDDYKKHPELYEIIEKSMQKWK